MMLLRSYTVLYITVFILEKSNFAKNNVFFIKLKISLQKYMVRYKIIFCCTVITKFVLTENFFREASDVLKNVRTDRYSCDCTVILSL